MSAFPSEAPGPVGPSPGPVRARFPLRVPRQRRGEVALGVALVIALAVSVLAVTGFIPGLLPSSPITLSQYVPTCSTSGDHLPSASRQLPAWATVHLSWKVVTPNDFVLYSVDDPTGLSVYFGGGTNGTGSFTSEGGAYSFDPSFLGSFGPVENTSCSPAVVTMTISYDRL